MARVGLPNGVKNSRIGQNQVNSSYYYRLSYSQQTGHRSSVTSSKSKKTDQHTHDMAQIVGGHVNDRIGAVPGPDSVNGRVTGPNFKLTRL